MHWKIPLKMCEKSCRAKDRGEWERGWKEGTEIKKPQPKVEGRKERKKVAKWSLTATLGYVHSAVFGVRLMQHHHMLVCDKGFQEELKTQSLVSPLHSGLPNFSLVTLSLFYLSVCPYLCRWIISEVDWNCLNWGHLWLMIALLELSI